MHKGCKFLRKHMTLLLSKKHTMKKLEQDKREFLNMLSI